MEIDAVHSESETYQPIEPEIAQWEKIGRAALIVFTFFATCAFIPALFRNKRVYSFSQTLLPNAPPSPTEVPQGDDHFPRCTPVEKGKVGEIFRTLAEDWVFNPLRLKTLGEEIDHIHPFAFLISPSKEHVQAIFRTKNGFKMGGVIAGIEKGMKKITPATLEKQIPDFAKVFEKDPGLIRQLIRAADWTGLVNYLFDIDAVHGA